VRITGIAAGGDGVGRLADGRAVFVPRTVPGDEVSLRRDIEIHRHFARAEVDAIVTAGPHRARISPLTDAGGASCSSCRTMVSSMRSARWSATRCGASASSTYRIRKSSRRPQRSDIEPRFRWR